MLLSLAGARVPANRPEQATPYCGRPLYVQDLFPLTLIAGRRVLGQHVCSGKVEIAAVLLNLANELKVLQTDLNRLLISLVTSAWPTSLLPDLQAGEH